MQSYALEVWQEDNFIHSVKGVDLERPAHAWAHIAGLATRFALPGCRFAVKNGRGEITILIGIRTAQRMLAAQAASEPASGVVDVGWEAPAEECAINDFRL
jgi:hypothetical protein